MSFRNMHFPLLPFLASLEFRVFFPCEEFLVFLSVSRIKSLVSWRFSNKTSKGRTGFLACRRMQFVGGHGRKPREIEGGLQLVVRGLLGTDPPDLTLESASPSPPQRSIWHRFDIDSTSISWFDPRLFRCQIEL